MKECRKIIYEAEYIEQPTSGEYEEKIYDINRPFRGCDWSWIRFQEEDNDWCGEFRGKYRGLALSKKFEIVVVLTSNGIYILDINSGELIESKDNYGYGNIIASSAGDIFIADFNSIYYFTSKRFSDIKKIKPSLIYGEIMWFKEINNDTLTICVNQYPNGDIVELQLDLKSKAWKKDI